MEISFEPITNNNISEALSIYNWYVLNSTATFHIDAIEAGELKKMISIGHPKYQSFVIIADTTIIGFCYLSQFRYKEAYDRTAEVTLYLDQNQTKKGIGKKVLLFFGMIKKVKGLEVLLHSLKAVIFVGFAWSKCPLAYSSCNACLRSSSRVIIQTSVHVQASLRRHRHKPCLCSWPYPKYRSS